MGVKGWLRGHFTRQGRNMRLGFQQMHDVGVQRHEEFLGLLGPEGARFFILKWRLDVNNWKPGDMPRRPRTARELAEELGKSVAQVEALDEKVVALGIQAMTVASYYRLFHAEMAVPLDSAREWWDTKIGSGGWHPDGLDASQRP